MSDRLLPERPPLPPGWCETTLGACLDVLRGVSYAKEQSRSDPADGFIPILRANNIGEALNFDDLVYVQEVCISDDQMLRVGDIVVAASSGSMKVVGKAAPLTAPWRGAFGAFCYALRVHRGLAAEYVAAFLHTEEYRNQASERAKGTNINNLRREHITSVRIRLAPLAEQTRIADRIDELFTDLAAGVAALERVKRNLSRYRAAVLHAAVTGRLTEAWRKQHGPPDEPGPKLLERILAERRRQWEQRTRAKYERDGRPLPKNWRDRYPEPAPPKPPADGPPLPELPEGWCWASFDQCADVQGGLQKSPSRAPVKSHYPYLRVANVLRGRLDLAELHRFELEPDELEKLRLEPGDLLIVEGNGSVSEIGRSALWQGEVEDCVHQNHIIRCRFAYGILPKYADTYVNSPLGTKYMRGVASSTSGLHTLSVGKVRSIDFPLPPSSEQSAIVEAVNEKRSQIDGLEAEIERGLARASRLRQAILKAAFEGRLVPQDPADEPASVLLERIRAEAAASSAVPRKKRAVAHG